MHDSIRIVNSSWSFFTNLGVSGIKQTNIKKGNGITDPAKDNWDQSNQKPKI